MMNTISPSDSLAQVADAIPLQAPFPRRTTVMQITWSLVAGGAEMYALTIASNLDAREYRPLLCAVDQGGALEGEIRRLGMPYTIMHRRPGIDWKLMWRLWRLFRSNQVDVIQTHHFNQLFYSLPGAILTGTRIIHTEHSIEAYKKRHLRIALRLMSLFCHKVIAIGSDGQRTLRHQVGIPARKLQVIRAGVNTRHYDIPPQQARQELGLEMHDRVVTIVARLFPEKNHRLLLQAFASVVRRLDRAKLLIVGDGIEENAIRQHVAELKLESHVRLLGVRRDVPRILAASDLFVISSDREGLPIAVLEAMAAARPVVATAVGDLPLVVHDRQTGRLVPRRDPHALAAALTELLADPQTAQAMGDRARQLVQEKYALPAMIAQYGKLYRASCPQPLLQEPQV